MAGSKTYELTFHHNDAGPGQREFEFSNGQVKVKVLDVCSFFKPCEAILIHVERPTHKEIRNWLYVFQSNKYPPQEPRLFMNKNNHLSIQGVGTVMDLKVGPVVLG